MASVLVIGGGLSGLSAAHTVYERGGNVTVLEKVSPPLSSSSALTFPRLPFPSSPFPTWDSNSPFKSQTRTLTALALLVE